MRSVVESKSVVALQEWISKPSERFDEEIHNSDVGDWVLESSQSYASSGKSILKSSKSLEKHFNQIECEFTLNIAKAKSAYR